LALTAAGKLFPGNSQACRGIVSFYMCAWAALPCSEDEQIVMKSGSNRCFPKLEPYRLTHVSTFRQPGKRNASRNLHGNLIGNRETTRL